MGMMFSSAYFFAALAILLWSSLAFISVALKSVPPLLLTGLALLIGSIPSWHRVMDWRLPLSTLLLGVYGLFGYHFLLFLAFQKAPAIEVNLINYLWPILMIVLSPILLPQMILRPLHLVAGVIGFAGAALAITSGQSLGGFSEQTILGFWLALGAAFVWSTYSLACRRVRHFSTSAIGLFALISGALALTAHFLIEPSYTPTSRDWALITVLGLGPLGGAFYAWDYAIKQADPRLIGIMSFATPILSTTLLMLFLGRAFNVVILLSVAMIVGAGYLGMKASQSTPRHDDSAQ